MRCIRKSHYGCFKRSGSAPSSAPSRGAWCIALVAAVLGGFPANGRPASNQPLVYVDHAYAGLPDGTPVAWPNGGAVTNHTIGSDAFAAITNGVTAAAPAGAVFVAAGFYIENVTVDKALTLIGPNAGKSGADPGRVAEAVVIPIIDDPETTPVLSVIANDVVVDGFFLNGDNPGYSDGYDANGVDVNATAAVQNGIWPDLVDIDHLTIQNSIITNFPYDGIYLASTRGTTNGFNYLRNNKFVNMWEGLETYALHAAIVSNLFESVNWGLSVHGITTPASPGFTPVVANNILTVGEWFPGDLPGRTNAYGIWINYRRAGAAELDVVNNVINTPAAAPADKTIYALFALTVDGDGKVNFINNVVNGAGNCNQGVRIFACPNLNAVNVLGGALNNIRDDGIIVETTDANWGVGDALVTVSNVAVTMSPAGTGVLAYQASATPANKAQAIIIGNTALSGGAAAVRVLGVNAAATLRNNSTSITGNRFGVAVSAGKALVENNNLTGNRVAALLVENGGTVDAGDCSGGNATGLGTGSAANGSSAGLNDLSGYGFDNTAPWAITNGNSAAQANVRADQNNFGAGPGQDIAAVLYGHHDNPALSTVAFSQNPEAIACPPTVNVLTLADVPLGAANLDQFAAQGGVYSASTGTVSFSDSPGDGGITRTYSLTDACGNVSRCEQIINVGHQINGLLQLDSFNGSGTLPAHTRTVTFVATDGPGSGAAVLKTWSLALTNASGDTFSYTLTGVPSATAGLSAKTAWNLRVKLPVSLAGGNAAGVNFTGSSLLAGGDLNNDNVVNFPDYSTLGINYFSVDPVADIDGDGVVSFNDYSILYLNWFTAGGPE